MRRRGITRRLAISGGAIVSSVPGSARERLFRPEGGGTSGTLRVGYYAVVTMDAGPVYNYSPDNPDPSTTVVPQQPFVSDFAGFTQGSVHVYRDDNPLRMYFRKDVTPDPTRIEIILELGGPVTNSVAQGGLTTDGSNANLAGFTLQIFHSSGIAQSVPYPLTTNLRNTSTAPHFPSFGCFTRWRWNPRPRTEARSRTQLHSPLNLIPNYNQESATKLNCVDVGQPGAFGADTEYYSGAVQGNNLNPVGVNENGPIGINTTATGNRPEIGLINDWQANYIINGNPKARKTMYIVAEVQGGMPLFYRDLTTGAPVDFTVKTTSSYFNTKIPGVIVPSSGSGWQLDAQHSLSMSYIPYILTGDPFYLENVQFLANWDVGYNNFRGSRSGNGYQLNEADPLHGPFADSDGIALLPAYLSQTRALGWSIRNQAQAYIATPESVPDWLLPKSYFKTVLDQNQQYWDKWGSNHAANVANSTVPGPSYAGLDFFGHLPVSTDFELGYMLGYLMTGLGFAVNQARLAELQPYLNYTSTLLVGMSSGLTAWDNRWPSPYNFQIQPVSTDHNSSPETINNWSDLWNYTLSNAILGGLYYGTTQGFSTSWHSFYPPWQPNTQYNCNSWAVVFRGGIPVPPKAGETVSLTVAGSFSGSPITVSYRIKPSDVSTMSGWTISGNVHNTNHPIIDGLASLLNANALLSAAGIKAVPDATTTGYIHINFDSTKIGNIVVTGKYVSTTGCSLYITPAGDGVTLGNHPNPALFGRPVSYVCAKTGLSGTTGPTGVELQTMVADGANQSWCFAPEMLSFPIVTPGTIGTFAAFPALLPNINFGYVVQAWAAMGIAATAGVPNAATAHSNLAQQISTYLRANPGIAVSNYNIGFNFAMNG